ncbi:hypothetical protein [Salipiger mucosus]|uniref:Uncharacterized protein n=1 Tax=Salipiger mucosus DSM 16094 TaxID=1123237 RepID=S9S0B3_9RHOB|nr:hypothetical protein [Salipiger mucosus]EPX79659.1 hypothetical protein Salmuc_05600 [Salipiger mucosus DSM 16094]
MRTSVFFGALAALTVSASGALAWNDAYTGDATADPSRQPLVQAYPAANYCPAGKQPVILGGVICCGVPNAGTYYNPVSVRKAAPRPAPATSYMPRPYAPVGEKGVAYD